MADPLDDGGSGLTRREWLKHAGIAGAVAAVAPAATLPRLQSRSPQGDPLETLTAAEAAVLDAAVARLIPSDALGPGAREARAARYIDRALGGALAGSREAYRSGLAAMDAYATRAKGGAFAGLSESDQDAVLSDMETNKVPGFTPSSAAFFTLLRTHTWQGTFGDPHYGGNANFVGWDLLGYPGLRLAVSAGEQQLDARLKPVRSSAYDLGMFAEAAAGRADPSHQTSWRLDSGPRTS
jgi:gluconate 2-dehydrogenase gamma chain